MRRRIPLAAKLGVSFVLVILLAVALVYSLTAWSIARQFSEYSREKQTALAEQLAEQLAHYRSANGTWDGIIPTLLQREVYIPVGEYGIEGSDWMVDVPFILIEANGVVITTNILDWAREQQLLRDLGPNESIVLSQQELMEDFSDGIPIVVNGQREGVLVVRDADVMGPSEQVFLSAVSRSALIGGGIAIALALFLSTVLIVQILRPLRALSRATESLAEGDMPEQVRLKTHDELGQLGDSFNHMLESLRVSETVRQTMTADIAHELRTPVTIIQGTLEAILDGIYEASEESIVPIYEETLHLGRLIDDLRDLALAEAGELRLEKAPVDLPELVQQVAETAFLSREHAPNLHLDLPASLPKVPLDSKRFRQVIANLLSNAIRYTPQDRDVYIRARRLNGDVELTVEDTGPGIDREDLPHLFERFYRADPARGRSAGSGLGLAIVKQWVEAHGGTIEAGNRTTGGARFTMRLPLS